jgi:sortase (surface protein transpeptidase)
VAAGQPAPTSAPAAPDGGQGDESGATSAPGQDQGQGPSLSALVDELPPAPVGFPAAQDGPRPVALTIEALGIDRAPVIDVGVETGGDMEVPPADEVGWYRYSPLPGAEGSSILAAHIAYDGRDGVFVRLADIEPGAEVQVIDEDGAAARFRVSTVERYAKEALPEDVVFARDGDPRLVLVTCGGRFDQERRSYDDNIVVVATPVQPAG